MKNVPALVKRLYKVVEELGKLPGAKDRRFTPDGHLVGSLGEVIAAYEYGLELLPNSTPVHDAVAVDGTLVQIKMTQGKSVGLRENPDHLLVLSLSPTTGEHSEAFNGPGDIAWNLAGKMQSNGQRPVSLAKLKSAQKDVPRDQVLLKVQDGYGGKPDDLSRL